MGMTDGLNAFTDIMPHSQAILRMHVRTWWYGVLCILTTM